MSKIKAYAVTTSDGTTSHTVRCAALSAGNAVEPVLSALHVVGWKYGSGGIDGEFDQAHYSLNHAGRVITVHVVVSP